MPIDPSTLPIAAANGAAGVLTDLFIVLLAAKIGDEIFKRIGQPAIIGEILAGVVVGPSVLGFVEVGEVLEIFAELGVIFLLFWVGLETRVSEMLAVGRALMTNPRLLILDEATEGLAPLIRREIWRCLAKLKAQGQSVLVIDKNVAALTRIADRHYMIERGRVVWTGTSAELAAAPDIQHRYLGV